MDGMVFHQTSIFGIPFVLILQGVYVPKFTHETGFQTLLSHEKNPYSFPLYWLVNRDPYNGLLKSLYNWVV